MSGIIFQNNQAEGSSGKKNALLPDGFSWKKNSQPPEGYSKRKFALPSLSNMIAGMTKYTHCNLLDFRQSSMEQYTMDHFHCPKSLIILNTSLFSFQ
ncbi:hypothetical protein BY996DRAFT_6572607 [Phakopsora pachyrhizi]|nr:hypothetical protein BY996DRAFT_6572607 [Phakopsora pachyrhizi]